MHAPPRPHTDERQPSRWSSSLPNLLIIGAMKSGTTALHYYLSLHPQVHMSRPKELNFFCGQPEVEGTVDLRDPRELQMVRDTPSNWSLGTEWYSRHFRASAPVRGEASPAYTAPWQPRAAERMASVVPHARLIFVVRDPIDRLLSEYRHYCAHGLEWRAPREAFAGSRNLYLERSRYWSRLEPFVERFPASSILVLSSEELFQCRRETVQTTYDFCAIDDSFWSPKMERIVYAAKRAAPMESWLERMRKLPVLRATHRLPPGIKWQLRRIVSLMQPREGPSMSIDSDVLDGLRSELRSDIARFREWSGRDFREWAL